MANRWKGNFVVATAATSSGTNYTGKANGAWGLNSQLQQKQGGLWAKGVNAPPAPTIGTVNAANAQATVPFTAPLDSGGGTISTYTATSSPGNIVASSLTSPIAVTGLTNGTAYTFTVTATSNFGVSPASSVSNSVTPQAISEAIFYTSYGTPTQANGWSASSGFGPSYTLPASYTQPTDSLKLINSDSILFTGSSFNSSDSINAYNFSIAAGFGTKFANPSPATAGTISSIDYINTGNLVYSATDGNISGYPWNNTSGFGTKYANVNTGGYIPNISVGAGGQTIVASLFYSPFIALYYGNMGSLTKQSNPATLPSYWLRCVKVAGGSPTYLRVACGGSDTYSPPMTAYKISNGSFGTKYANPTGLNNGAGVSISFNSDQSKVAIAGNFSPYAAVLPFDFFDGFGTKYADPSITLPTNSTSVAFSKNDGSIAIGANNAPYITTLSWSNSSGFGTKYQDPSIVSTFNNAVSAIAFTTS
jgi:hypothetical protein